MEVSLEIIAGVSAGEKFRVESRRQVQIGRGANADIAVTADPLLSESHFTFLWDETGCRIRDLQSAHGTFLNGQKINQAAVRNGDKIVAGQTHFVVRVKRESAEPASTLASPRQPAIKQPDSPTVAEFLQRPTQTPAARDLLDLLRAEPEPLFAILDAARDPKVLEILRNCDQTYQSLYEGAKGEELADFAPYLVELPARASLIEPLIQKGWGKSWGVYLTCPKMFTDIRRHLRHFLIVELEGAKGKQHYFRFYDPRVLRVFLTTCTQPEIREFFGPISSYLMEADEPRELLKFTPARPTGIREAVRLRPENVSG